MDQDGNIPRISVAIPLYNKEKEIAATLESALTQSFSPVEVIVVNDGSTDRGPEIVKGFGSPLIRLIDQPNAGVSAARNRATVEAAGDLIAYLDGDDMWTEGYLAKIASMITEYPGCGAYSAALDIVSGNKIHPAKSLREEGIVEDFFREAMKYYICQPSATVIPKTVLEKTGGFPEGMKMGEDLYLWIKIASEYKICFTPERLVRYNRTASNRSVGIYTPEKTIFSFEDLYRPEEGNSYRNEYIARCAIGKALTLSAKGDTVFGRRTAEFFSYTRLYRRGLRKLRILNRIPQKRRSGIHSFYNRMAWNIARRGF